MPNFESKRDRLRIGSSRRFRLGTPTREDESLPGYLIRAAARVGTRADRLAGMAGLRQPGSATSTASLERLAELLNMKIAALDRLAYRPTPRFAHNRFRAGSVHREMIDISARRACPACLRERDHHRAAWDLALLTCCPVHGVRLATRCPKCSRKLGWADPSVVICRCGSDVRDWATTSVTGDEALANARLLALASGETVEWLPAPLSACETADLVWLAMCLGMFFTGWAKERRVETLCAAGPDAVARVIISGIAAMAEWPFPLLAFLGEERMRASARTGRYGARKTLGPFYAWLRDVDAPGIRDVLLAAVRDSVHCDPVLARRVHRSELLAGTESGAAVGLVGAARILGRSQETAKRLLAGQELAGGASAGRGVPMAFSRSAVERMAHEDAGAFTLEQAADALAISKARARLLADAGLFLVRERPARGQRAQWAIDRDSVHDLLRRLEAKLETAWAGRAVGFNSAAEALRRMGVDLPEMVRMILEGRLAPVLVDEAERGLRRLCFDAREVRQVCRGLDGSPVVTVQVAAERLGLKWEVVAHLVRHGILKECEGGVAADEVARFAADYVSGAELARELGTSPRALARRLEAQGVRPVSGPGVDGGRQNFFRRVAFSAREAR